MPPTFDRLTIALPRDLSELVRDGVASGDYASASELVREALRLWRQVRPDAPPRQALRQVAQAVHHVAPILPLDEIWALCVAQGVKSLWACGDPRLPQFVVEFIDALTEGMASGVGFGRLAMFQIKLEMLLYRRVAMMDVMEAPEYSRWHLYNVDP